MTYNAENRLISFCSDASCTQWTQFVYDAAGNRVQRMDSNAATTTFVYDAFGNLAAEYGAPPSATGTQYVTVDALGSTRLVMQGTQASERHDFGPYGDELGTAGRWRPTVTGYGVDATRQKFTGQERDSETGLDYFLARYYSGIQGRLGSPDPGNAGASPTDPQSWNGYAYVSGNPLTYTDPTGQVLAAGTETGALICGPVCAGIGAAVDVGLLLLGIFDGGGSRPDLSSVAFTPGPLQPTLGGGADGDPFGIPAGGGGSSSPGGGFGGGMTGNPFIFSFGDDAGGWIAGTRNVLMYTWEWWYGLAPRHRTFGPNTIEVKNMRTAPGVEKARQFFYSKVSCGPLEPVSGYDVTFGLKGLLSAGTNPTRQFVGTYSVNITPSSAGDAAVFSLKNTTSFTSFFYGLGPSWEAHSGPLPTPMANASQTFYWTERIPQNVFGRSCGGK